MSRNFTCDYIGDMCSDSRCTKTRCAVRIEDEADFLNAHGHKIKRLEERAAEMVRRVLKAKRYRDPTTEEVTKYSTKRSILALAKMELDFEKAFLRKVSAPLLFRQKISFCLG